MVHGPVNGGADGIEASFYLNTAGHPVVLDEIVLAAALLEGLYPRPKLDTTRGSTYRFFETPFGVPMLKAQE
jgi:hypothetical protein